MIGRWRIEGHAVVSADDMIADGDGETPPGLRIEADWTRFQRMLDRATVVALGRLSHLANPNRRHRNRLILSSSSSGIERRADGWWWNPGRTALAAALAVAAPDGGLVAVPGGRQVFDLFLVFGYDAFHLTRVPGMRYPGGIPVFTACGEGRTAEMILSAAGLQPDPPETLDREGAALLTVWRGGAR